MPPLLQQLWLSGSAAVSCSGSISQLLAAAPVLSHAATAVMSQVRWSSSSSSTPVVAKQQKQQKQPQDKAADTLAAAAAEQQAADDKQLALLKQQYQRSRMQDYYSNHLARELLLKLNVANVHQLPRVKSIHLSINAKETHGRRYAEKWEMLLPALALEYITGKPATYVHSTLKYYRSRNAVTAVQVHLEGGAALDLLQKLTYVVLPSQNAFGGITTRSLDSAGNLHFRIQKMINFPDFEEQFEIFENLGSLHVSINMGNVGRKQRGRSQLLMTGLQLPMLEKRAAVEEAEQEASSGNEEDDPSASDGRMSAADD